MDKQTLSNYGWIVICVLVLATLLAFATPFSSFLAKGFEATSAGFEFTSYQQTSEVLGDYNPPLLEELQSRYKFEYYSSLALAVDDINDGTIGKNADRNKEDAVAGIYTDRGKTYALLLKDNTEERRVNPKVDMTINLGGNTLCSKNNIVIRCEGGNIIIDGRLEGSTIKQQGVGYCVSAPSASSTEINGGTYILEGVTSSTTKCSALITQKKLTVNNATIIANGHYIGGIASKGSYADIVVNNCTIDVCALVDNADGISATNKLNINSSKINVSSTFTGNGTNNLTGIAFHMQGNEFDNKITININNTEIVVNSFNSIATGIRIPSSVGSNPMTLETELNLYNTRIYIMSKNNIVYGIIDSGKKNPVINIVKSDIVAESHSTQSGMTAYGILSNNTPTITIDRSAVIANKQLEKTGIQNSIGISAKGIITTKYSNIFGTKAKIEQ